MQRAFFVLQWRQKEGVKGMLYFLRYDSPLGGMTLVSRGEALEGAWFEGQKYELAGVSGMPAEQRRIPVLADASAWLDSYFSGGRPSPGSLPLAPQGSAFRQEIWQMLCGIPYGETVTYGELAGEYARRHGLTSMSAQAAGGAVGHNPISVIIPCHRVVGANGSLTGYAGGLERKRWLLRLEGAELQARP